MDQYKPWYASSGTWGALASFIAGIAGMAGYMIDPAMQQNIAVVGMAFATSIGGIVALIGRIKATHKIGKPAAEPNLGPGVMQLENGMIVPITQGQPNAQTPTATSASPAPSMPN